MAMLHDIRHVYGLHEVIPSWLRGKCFVLHEATQDVKMLLFSNMWYPGTDV